MKYKIILFLLLLVVSCNRNNSSSNEKEDTNRSHSQAIDSSTATVSMSGKEENDLIWKSIKGGDAKAYNRVSGYFALKADPGMFYYSLVMAQKYNLAEAYDDLYFFLSSPNTGERFEDEGHGMIAVQTKHLAIFFLLKSYEINRNGSAQFSLKYHFKDMKNIPKARDYLQAHINEI